MIFQFEQVFSEQVTGQAGAARGEYTGQQADRDEFGGHTRQHAFFGGAQSAQHGAFIAAFVPGRLSCSPKNRQPRQQGENKYGLNGQRGLVHHIPDLAEQGVQVDGCNTGEGSHQVQHVTLVRFICIKAGNESGREGF